MLKDYNGKFGCWQERQLIKKGDEQRRIAAAASRTPEQQLARLDAGGLVAAKERAKIALKIKALADHRTGTGGRIAALLKGGAAESATDVKTPQAKKKIRSKKEHRSERRKARAGKWIGDDPELRTGEEM